MKAAPPTGFTSPQEEPSWPDACIRGWALRLARGSGPEKLEAVLRLASAGPNGIEPLCRGLRDRSEEVRIHTARLLAQVGDERAIPHLTAALRRCFAGGSSRWQALLGAGLLTATLVLWGGATFLFGPSFYPFRYLGVLSFIILLLLLYYYSSRQDQGRCIQEITAALLAIGRRHPTPELAPAVRETRWVAGDALQQGPETRRAAREAADELERLIRDRRELPVPSSPAPCDPASLPRPSKAPGEVISAPGFDEGLNGLSR